MKKIEECYNCEGKNILQEADTAICSDCGYQTSNKYTKNSIAIKKIKETSPKIVRENLKFDEELQRYWLLTVVHINKKGCVFPNEDKKWVFMKYIPIPVNERINYPIPETENEYYEFTVDPTSEKVFDKFKDAINELKEI